MRNLSLFGLLLSSLLAYAQSAKQAEDIDLNAVQIYLDSVGRNSILYNGFYSAQSFNNNDEHPYLEKSDWTNANLTYKGIYYPNVKLRYNLVEGVVIVDDRRGIPLILDNSQIQKLEIFNRTFAPIEEGDDPLLYEWLYKGNHAIVAKRIKLLKRVIEYPSVKIFYESEDEYYLLKGGLKYKVSNRSSLLRSLSDRKKQLKNYMRENRILYNENPERAMVLIISHYDLLSDEK